MNSTDEGSLSHFAGKCSTDLCGDVEAYASRIHECRKMGKKLFVDSDELKRGVCTNCSCFFMLENQEYRHVAPPKDSKVLGIFYSTFASRRQMDDVAVHLPASESLRRCCDKEERRLHRGRIAHFSIFWRSFSFLLRHMISVNLKVTQFRTSTFNTHTTVHRNGRLPPSKTTTRACLIHRFVRSVFAPAAPVRLPRVEPALAPPSRTPPSVDGARDYF